MTELNKIGYQNLGFRPYQESILIQDQLRELLINQKTDFDGFVLFLYHEPVITLGKYSDNSNLLVSPSRLRELGVGFYHCDRGGDITCHEPGQIVIYPVINLRNFNLKLKEYVYLLERVVMEALTSYQIHTDRKKGKPGLWIDNNKIASIGISVKRHCTKHGIALNVNNSLENFNFINPCGYQDIGITSVKNLIKSEVNLKECCDSILDIFSTTFNANMDKIDINDLVILESDQMSLSA